MFFTRVRMRSGASAVLGLAVLLAPACRSSPAQSTLMPPLSEEARTAAIEFLKASACEPRAYVVRKFADHDVVLVGEIHEIADNCRFVSDLIPVVYRDAGVHVLATEFIRSRFNESLDRVVTAPQYDESAVIDMFRDGAWPTWGYREYMDIVRAAWTLNTSLPAGQPRFRIVGLDSDWRQADMFGASSQAQFKIRLSREDHLVDTFKSEVLRRKAKALVHLGFAHSVDHGERFAARVRRTRDTRVFQICLHHDIPGKQRRGAMTETLEGLMRDLGNKPLGFDVAGSPLGGLRDSDCPYFAMLGSKATLASFAEGYVFLKPVADLAPVTWVRGFIDARHYPEALEVAARMRMVEREKCPTPESLNEALAARLSKLP